MDDSDRPGESVEVSPPAERNAQETIERLNLQLQAVSVENLRLKQRNSHLSSTLREMHDAADKMIKNFAAPWKYFEQNWADRTDEDL